MDCPQCTRPTVITIRMRISAEEIVFHRCSVCEANIWASEGSVLTLDEVLDLARSAR
jgi:hypothetical protein